eukprot:GFYU01011164.1.p1 GENE.GFYU01011164.1~~GFYU01011164.1.p1  ORF type:complete len:368 (+),score=58.32 GFYU01011164.1:147-1106(+)
MFKASTRKQSENERISAREYLDRYNVPLYVNDIVRQLVDTRVENPLECLHEYFSNVLKGNHVLFRDYEFVNSTPHNRLSFLGQIVEAYQNFDGTEELAYNDFHQLLCVLCPDFPLSLVEDASDCLQLAEEEARPFLDWIPPFQTVFYFVDFLYEARLIFSGLDITNTGDIYVEQAKKQILEMMRNKQVLICIPHKDDINAIFALFAPKDSISFPQFRRSLLAQDAFGRVVSSTEFSQWRVASEGIGFGGGVGGRSPGGGVSDLVDTLMDNLGNVNLGDAGNSGSAPASLTGTPTKKKKTRRSNLGAAAASGVSGVSGVK